MLHGYLLMMFLQSRTTVLFQSCWKIDHEKGIKKGKELMNNTELFMISRGKSIFTGIPGRVSRRTILYLERPLSPARIQIKAIPLVAHGRSKAKQKINTPRANTQNKHSEFTNPRKTWSKTTGDAIHQPKILGVTFRR